MSRSIDVSTESAAACIARSIRKIVPVDELADRLAVDSVPCVLTKGVFDLLHAGHLHLFAYCAELARSIDGRVVVAVAEDAVVRARKGPTRPNQPLARRLAQIAAVSDVDFVLPAAQPEPIDIIDRLRPAFYVKGADTALGSSVGTAGSITVVVDGPKNQDLIRAIDCGARVVVFTDDGKLSTSDLVKAILAASR